MYDEKDVSAEFRRLAEEADRNYRDLMRSSAPAEELDAVLAHSCVYGYLYARHFLESTRLLLNELRWLKQTDRPRPPRHARSTERFQRARDELIDGLIERFSAAG